MACLPKYDLVSIEDLEIAEIERIFKIADSFADGSYAMACHRRSPPA